MIRDQIEAILADPNRLTQLDQLALLDTPPEAALDELTSLAARTLRAPMALVSLVDRHRQFFASAVGLPAPWSSQRQTPLSLSYCKYVVASQAPLIVEDATQDPDFRDHPANEALGVGSYIGVPLTCSDGACIGTFCLIDPQPRNWSDEDLALVELLAKAAMTQVELRAALRRKHRELVAGQDAMRAAEERLRVLYRNTSEGVLVLAEDGTIMFANEAVSQLSGHPKDAIVGRNALDLITGDQVAALRSGLASCVSQPGVAFTLEYRIQHPDGGWRDRSLIAVNWLRDPTVQGIVVTVRDLTERKALERQLQFAQKMDALGRMAAGVVHDFNNMLLTMYGVIDGLLLDEELSDERRADVLLLQKAADRAATLSRQLLTFSRTQTMTPEVIDINRHLQQFQPLLARTLQRRSTLHTDLGPGSPRVRMNIGELDQVLLNLVVNANDAMPNGGTVTITTRAAEYAPVGTSGPRTPHLKIDVSDTGVGIDSDTVARIFEPFFTTKGQGAGTGLGLATVYGIVSRAGGTIEVNSEVGRGTTFSICVPAHPESE